MPLHESVFDALPLTWAERAACRLFVLNSDHYPEADCPDDEGHPPIGRFAVCAPCPREQWGRLLPGQILVYTELYQPVDALDPDCPAALITHVGPLRLYDEKRGLFYATSWQQFDEECDLDAEQLKAVWVVRRFISFAA